MIYYLKLTDKCPSKCKHCYRTKEIGELDLNSLSIPEDSHIILHGGEPLLYSNIEELHDFCSNYRYTAITTSLCCPVTQERLDLLAYAVSKIKVSWDPFLRDYTLTQKEYFNQWLDLLDHSKIEFNITLERNLVATDPVLIINALLDYGISDIHLERLAFTKESIFSLAPSPKAQDDFVCSFYDLAKAYGIRVINLEQMLQRYDTGGETFCDKCSEYKTISTNGEAGCIVCSDIMTVNERILADDCNYCPLYKNACPGDCWIYSFDQCRQFKNFLLLNKD